MRGIAANRVGNFTRAACDLRMAVRSYGLPRLDTRDAFNEYALALRGTGDDDAAEQVLRDLVHTQSDFGAAWHNLAMVLHTQGALDEAVAAARRSVAMRPNDPGAPMLLGKLLNRARLLACHAALLRARELAPDDVSIETTLGNTLFYLGEIDAALGCLPSPTELYIPTMPSSTRTTPRCSHTAVATTRPSPSTSAPSRSTRRTPTSSCDADRCAQRRPARRRLAGLRRPARRRGNEATLDRNARMAGPIAQRAHAVRLPRAGHR